jgi:uncharacterized protein
MTGGCSRPDAPEDTMEGEAVTRVVETHISTLLFIGDRVYKLRKPVRFGFLDFTERAARRADCEREVRLNRRLAPDVYLGVADVVLEGRAVDHMVVMRRLPDSRRLGALAARGVDLDGLLHEIAGVLARFHVAAERSEEISAAATAEALLAQWEANFAESEPFVGDLLDGGAEAEIRRLARAWVRGRVDLLRRRIDEGWICDGHGDLQADDIFCLPDGVRILDCLEFSDRLRHGDVVADLTFLAMDLERLGRSDGAERLLSEYQNLAGTTFPKSLVHHYWGLRAYVRAEVACLRARQGAPGAPQLVSDLHRRALEHLRAGQVRMVLVGGLPGSGKSTLAAGLADALGWRVVRSDEVRAELYPAPAGAGAGAFGQGRYGPGPTEATYHEMLQRARGLLGQAESVVLDATWTCARHRVEARAVAADTESALTELCCQTPSEVAERRIDRRRTEHRDLSEATAEVRRRMADAADAWPEAVPIDTGARATAATLQYVLDALAGARPGPKAGAGRFEGPW